MNFISAYTNLFQGQLSAFKELSVLKLDFTILHFFYILSSSPPSSKNAKGETSPNEEERQFLRDVELKVLRFIDKLEQRGAGSKTGLNIQKEAAKFREQLLQVCV